MLPRQARATARSLRRYDIGRGRAKKWHSTGQFTTQQLIPRCSAAHKREATRIMKAHHGILKSNIASAIRYVDVHRLRSFQNFLRYRSLAYCLGQFDKMQRTFGAKHVDSDRAARLPIVIWAHGVPVVWNGNHRVTAAILLD